MQSLSDNNKFKNLKQEMKLRGVEPQVSNLI